MTATSTLERPLTDPAPAVESEPVLVAPADSETKSAPGFGSVMAISIPLGMLVIFLVSAIGLTAYRGDAIGAVGLATFLAIWIGGGFGFIFGGAAWAVMNSDH